MAHSVGEACPKPKNLTFYPGGIWFKRMGNILILFTITTNLFLNSLQNHLFEAAERFVTWADNTTSSAIATADQLGQELIPKLEKIEKSGWGQMIEHLQLPTAQDLRNGLSTIKDYQARFRQYGVILSMASKILKWTSILMWIPILYAGLWLVCDYIWGNARWFIAVLVSLAGVFNLLVHSYLNDYLAEFIY
ncbi:MAG: hypothetical protein R2824_24115 [Saprospiraceae bacterium]|nr:hypothetical protein [Lewinella sp.]